MTWKILSSDQIYQNGWFSARRDKCLLPDGRILDPYFIVEIPSWTNMVIITKEQKIVLVRQYRHAYGQEVLELPGGILEKGEEPMASAIREMQEETGYVSEEVELLYQVSPNPALMDNAAYFFLARNAAPLVETSFDPYEDIQIETYTQEELKQLLKQNKLQHGVQLGAIYQAMIRLNWISW